MAALIACGTVWRIISPGKLEPELVRKSLGDLVYFLLLPALVLKVLWQAPLGIDSLHIAGLAMSGVIIGGGITALLCFFLKLPKHIGGALILASAFPNATYLGLPVLQATLGNWTQVFAIQYDLFATTPMLLTLGVIMAQYCGGQKSENSILAGLMRVPALWAALIAVILNIFSVPFPQVLEEWLGLLAAGVSLLMLISLGMSLFLPEDSVKSLGYIMIVVVVQLMIVPIGVWWFGGQLGVEQKILTVIVLEAAMPSMLLGLVICDRFGLHTKTFALAVTITTVLSMLTLPIWFSILHAQQFRM